MVSSTHIANNSLSSGKVLMMPKLVRSTNKFWNFEIISISSIETLMSQFMLIEYMWIILQWFVDGTLMHNTIVDNSLMDMKLLLLMKFPHRGLWCPFFPILMIHSIFLCLVKVLTFCIWIAFDKIIFICFHFYHRNLDVLKISWTLFSYFFRRYILLKWKNLKQWQ